MIYCEGDEPRDMMCLLKGKVKIFKEGVGGRSQIIRMIKPVQYFGYRANFAQENYLTNASAFEASTVCLIPMTIVTDLLMGNANLAMFFIRQLSLDSLFRTSIANYQYYTYFDKVFSNVDAIKVELNIMRFRNC